MPVYDSAARLDAAAYARRYFARTITLDTFLNYFSDSDDPLIRALVDALVHEPGRGGLFGLRDWWWQSRYWEPIERLLAELDKGAAGQAPAERVYPRITLWSLVVGALAVLWAGLFAAQHLEMLLSDIHSGGALPFWTALWRCGVVCTMGLVAAAGFEAWMDRLRLYRTRKMKM